MRTKAALVLLAALSSPASAQSRVDELFARGAFGVNWNATLEEVMAVHPGGDTNSLAATTTLYAVRDGRTVFELERRRRDQLTFTFIEGALKSIAVEFPDCIALTTKAHAVIGPVDGPNSNAPGTGGFATLQMGKWTGSAVTAYVTGVAAPGSASCMLIFGLSVLEQRDVPRSQLGLE